MAPLFSTTGFMFTLLSVTVVSLLSFIGLAFFPLSPTALRKAVFLLVSLAVGALFGDAFIHLLPEAYAVPGTGLEAPLLILGGILVFFCLEHILHWRHQHGSDGHAIEPYGYMNLTADILHNFIDGLIIGASFHLNTRLGMTTSLAVLLHEIPHEAGNFGILLQAGFPKGRALFLNFLTALTAILGGAAAWVFSGSGQEFSLALVPFTAGGFIYIAGSDLVPQLHRNTNPTRASLQLLAILIGVGFMVALKFWE
jgi:zinc and cadmium transporter